MFRRLTHTILTHKGLMYKNQNASQLFCSEKETNPVARAFSLKASLYENTI